MKPIAVHPVYRRKEEPHKLSKWVRFCNFMAGLVDADFPEGEPSYENLVMRWKPREKRK